MSNPRCVISAWVVGALCIVPIVADAGEIPEAEGRTLAIKSLESAYAAHPVPEILLTIGEIYENWGGHCAETLQTYRRYFAACQNCASLWRAVDRFDFVIRRCVASAEDEIATREQFVVPRAQEKERKSADATRREVAALLYQARDVDSVEARSLFATFVEVGHAASVVRLNELRAKGWEILSRKDATVEQVFNLLQRVKVVEPDQYEGQFGELMAAEKKADVSKLNELRQSAITLLTERSSGFPEAPAKTVVGCRPNPQREWGFLTVATRPWSEVYVNGEGKGQSPVSQVEVLAGCVTVRAISSKAGREIVQNVTIRPNKNAILKVDMEFGSTILKYSDVLRGH